MDARPRSSFPWFASSCRWRACSLNMWQSTSPAGRTSLAATLERACSHATSDAWRSSSSRTLGTLRTRAQPAPTSTSMTSRTPSSRISLASKRLKKTGASSPAGLSRAPRGGARAPPGPKTTPAWPALRSTATPTSNRWAASASEPLSIRSSSRKMPPLAGDIRTSEANSCREAPRIWSSLAAFRQRSHGTPSSCSRWSAEWSPKAAVVQLPWRATAPKLGARTRVASKRGSSSASSAPAAAAPSSRCGASARERRASASSPPPFSCSHCCASSHKWSSSGRKNAHDRSCSI
mmetsp:Transcript_108519/g.294284  ORF Transcript_108519/g.294284 Transcript_108519/m.294284 type:complete len:292 (-) Transcript_108519:185-1060(-)